MTTMRTILAVVLATMGLAGCGSSGTASLMVDGNDVAITLERIKAYAWSEGWELQLVVRNNPDCQRRHTLKQAASDSPKIEIYSPEPYVFIVRQGKRWYVAEMKSCQLQAFKEAPPAPGPLVGTFLDEDGTLRYVPAAKGSAGS